MDPFFDTNVAKILPKSSGVMDEDGGPGEGSLKTDSLYSITFLQLHTALCSVKFFEKCETPIINSFIRN